jgi:outer membrane receptor protein involved in Fe transport
MKDALPDWAKGFGVSGNYTYIDSSQKLHRKPATPYCPAANAIGSDALKLYGCDTNGVPFGDLPLIGLSRHAANFALRYDRGGWSARLAYNWNSRQLKSVGVFGSSGEDGTSADPARAGATDTWWGLPKWEEAYGQWDAGFNYNFNDKLSMAFSVSNLNNVIVRETQQQTPGNMGTAWRMPGRSYYLSGRYEF